MPIAPWPNFVRRRFNRNGLRRKRRCATASNGACVLSITSRKSRTTRCDRPSAESEQKPAGPRKTPSYVGLTVHEYGQPPLSRRGRVLVNRVKRKKVLNVLKRG